MEQERKPSAEEIAKELELELSEVVNALSISRKISSLDTSFDPTDDGAAPLSDLVPDIDAQTDKPLDETDLSYVIEDTLKGLVKIKKLNPRGND